MTNPTPEAATFAPMTFQRLPLALLAAACLTAPLRAQGTDPDAGLRELLRDALYTEEVTRDPEAAAKQYEALLAKHDAQRAFAAAALFRLAEVRRKQDRKDEAIALYQRLLREFPAAETEGKLARENLAALGAKIEAPASPADDEEAIELKRLQQWVESSPDRLKDPELLLTAIKEGRLESIKLLLKAGAAGQPWKLLEEAVRSGNLDTIRFLLDHPFKGHRGLDETLFLAITLEFSDVTRLLLDRGAKPDALGVYRISENVDPPSKTLALMSPLHVAVRKRDTDLCKLLLEHKADPNLLPDLQKPSLASTTMPGYPTGTPLHDAVVSSLEITRLLLDHGADVTVASPDSGFTALHSAVRPSHLVDDENGVQGQILKLLLEKGANLQAKTVGEPDPRTKTNRSGNQDNSIPPGTTPLMMATLSNNFAAVRVLIEAGAATSDPALLDFAVRSKIVEWVQLLVSPPRKPAISADALVEAVAVGSTDIIRLLVEAGADPNASSPKHHVTPLQQAARSDSADLLQLLFDLSAKPDPDWTSRNYEGSSLSSLPFLHQRFLVPSLQEKPAITAITPFYFSQPVELAAGSSGSPGALAELLLNPANRWPRISSGNTYHFPTRFTLWRKNAQAVQGRLDGPDPFPELQWGDVLEFSPDWEGIGGQPGSYNITHYDGLPPDVMWHARKRIAFPVTVEIDGVSRQLTLRGDRLIFDPGSDQVPLVGASRLADLLWKPEFSLLDLPKPELSVVRAGWPDVSIPWNPHSPADFPLKSGDRLAIKSPPQPDDLNDRRQRHVVVRGSNLPFVRIYGAPDTPSTSSPASLPTLIQAIADSGSYHTDTLRSAPADPEALPGSLLGSADLPLQLLPHADYSKIIIRRLGPDGKESRIPFDLAAVIANSTADITPEDARKADVQLTPGDIVEIPQLPGLAGTQWKGFTEAEVRFFAKALDCKVQVIDPQGGIELREIRYQAPRFIEIAGQWIPLPPTSGTETLNAGVAIGQNANPIDINRKGEEVKGLSASKAYLRDGDVIRIHQAPAPARVAPVPPAGQRVPRQRMIPPTPGR
jgi:ankyrin repeat protein